MREIGNGEKGTEEKAAHRTIRSCRQDADEQYRGTVSLPFEPGDHRRVAVKIVDDRGIESLKIEGLD